MINYNLIFLSFFLMQFSIGFAQDTMAIAQKIEQVKIYGPNKRTIEYHATKIDTLVDSLSNYEIGAIIQSSNPSVNGLKVGEWKTYNKNHQVISTGYLAVGRFIYCQFAGPSTSYYNFPLGEWKTYHPNGKLASTGSYIVTFKKANYKYGDVLRCSSKKSQNYHYYDSNCDLIQPTD